MECAFKTKLTFSETDSAIIDGQSRILNWTYNHLLEFANKVKMTNEGTEKDLKTVFSKRGLRNQLPELKIKYSFLKSVHSSPLKNAALRLSEGIEAYQKSRKGKRKGKPMGWPKYRKWSEKYFSLLYDEPKKGFKVSGQKLSLSLGTNNDGKRLKVVGELETSPFSLDNQEIRNLRIKKDMGEYFAIFTVKRSPPAKKSQTRIIAFDPNHKNLAYGVDIDGMAIEIENPWFLKTRQKRIDLLKAKRDKCKRRSQLLESQSGKKYWRPSRRWLFFNKKLEMEYAKRRDQTKQFLFTISHHLCRYYDVISVGDYTPRGGGINRGMRRAMNNESLIGRFKLTLGWVAQKSGKYADEWQERNSTKTCHRCQKKLEESLPPKIREWDCPNCHFHHIRDENAALNGLLQVSQKFKLPCSGHRSFEVNDRWALYFDGLGLACRSGV